MVWYTATLTLVTHSGHGTESLGPSYPFFSSVLLTRQSLSFSLSPSLSPDYSKATPTFNLHFQNYKAEESFKSTTRIGIYRLPTQDLRKGE